MFRTYRGGDEKQIVRTWNAAMPGDPIDLTVFGSKVLCDPNFQAEGLRLAVLDDVVVGFALSIERKLPLVGIDLEPEVGWITALAVDPDHRRRGIGTELLRSAENFFLERGKRWVSVSAYAPNYFWPGVDRVTYPEGLSMLESNGYGTEYEAVSMDKHLVAYAYPDDVKQLVKQREQEGYRFIPLTWEYVVELIGFANSRFNPDWGRAIRDGLSGRLTLDQCRIATNPTGSIVGFALYGAYDGMLERFGPFGVDEGERGKGLGKILLHETLFAMKSRGLHGAWFLWTGEETAAGHLYLKAGFSITREFNVMRKQLSLTDKDDGDDEVVCRC